MSEITPPPLCCEWSFVEGEGEEKRMKLEIFEFCLNTLYALGL
jgi:hypothetical protein